MSRTAIVCGAGMAGLLSARVLADFYDRVVIVERDELADEPLPRKGVPQGRYVHVLTLFGCAKDYPPRNEGAFREWLSALPPDFADLLDSATPLDDIVVWRATMNRLRRYDELTSRPSGLLFTGDSVCTLNPVYAQGMSVACLGARELRAALAEGQDDLAVRFQRRLANTLRFSWTVATGADHDILGSQGDPQTPVEADLASRWRRALLLVNKDPEILHRYYETLLLARPPDWLYSSELAERIAAATIVETAS